MGRDDHTAAPDDCLTLVMPLQARAGLSTHDFHDYWLNAHVTLPVAGAVGSHCEAVHAVRVNRCIVTKYQGAITLAGVRGVAVADVIRRLGASSQLEDEVSALFLPDPAHVLV